MRRKTALLISGLVTAFAMVVVVGIIVLAGRFTESAQAAAPAGTLAGIQATDPMQTTDVPTLQAQAVAYRTALQKAYQDLQTAYNQIKTLDSQVQQLSGQVQDLNAQGAQFAQPGQNGFEGRRRSRGGGGDDDGSQFFQSFGAGHDD